ncbi:MAG: cupredoxin domain-containing protein [Chloroflexota bacterium]|jgi:plastocyanin
MKRMLQAVALAGLAAMTVACSSGGSSSTPAPSAAASTDASAPAAGGTTVVAKDIAFDPTTLTIPADTATAITFDNQDAAPHNIAIKDASGAQVFKGEIVTQTKTTYNVNALPAGTYQFWCEVHPNMTGTLTVQ